MEQNFGGTHQKTDEIVNKIFKKITGCLKKKILYISVRINATVLFFIWAEIGGPPVRFAYRLTIIVTFTPN